jgi:pyruvate dehydrogenase E2 component (dihydrolipoamide acetyltransferase)
MPEPAATPVPMPRLGATMDEGVLLEWLKGEGDRVAEHEPLFEVETDKAVVQVESPVAGVVRSLLVKPGTVVPVGEAVALVAPEGAEGAGEGVRPAAPAASPPSPPSPMGSASPAPSAPGVPSPPPPPASGVHAGPAPVVDGVRLRMTPAARRLMRELGVGADTLRALAARGGRITRQVLLSAWEGAAVPAPAPAPAAPPQAPAVPQPPKAAGGAQGERVPLSPMRRAIARAMTRSAREIPQFSVTRTVDMAEVMAAVRALGAWSKEAPTVTDFLIHALAHALAAHPDLNAHMEGEDVLVRWPDIRLGLATATEAGLMVPTIRISPDTPLGEISRLRRAAVAQAQAGRLGAEEPTFTLSNLGPFAVDRFVALVNPPQVAILAAGTVAERPAVREGEVTVRPAVDLTVSADHRAVDGAEAARFLATVADVLARRDAWRLF